MGRFSFSSVRTRLMLLVLLAVAPSTALLVHNSWEQRRTAVSGAMNEASDLVHFAVIYEEELIRGTRQLLASLASIPMIHSDTERCDRVLGKFLEHLPQYANLGIIRSDGEVSCSALPLAGPTNLSDRFYFRDALEKKGFSIGRYQVGRITGKPSINFGYPVPDGKGGVGAVAFAALDLSWVAKYEFEIEERAPPGSTYVKLDRNGSVLASYPASYLFGRGSTLEGSLFDKIKAEQKGTFEGKGNDGVDRVYVFSALSSPIYREEAYVLLGIPANRLFAESDRLLARNLGVLLAVTMFALAATWFGGGILILRPVEALVAASKRLAAGDLSARAERSGTGGELGHLAHAFDEMAEKLESREEESRRMQVQLSEIRARLAHILATSPAVIYVCRIPEGKGVAAGYPPTFVSEKILDLFGYEPREVLGCLDGWRDYIHPEDRSSSSDLSDLFRKGRIAREYRFREKCGNYRWVLDSAVLVRDPAGTPVEIVGSWIDIMDRKRVEEQLAHSQKMEAVGRLAGGVAHDFNNLLTAISGYSEMLLMRLPGEDPSRSEVGRILKAADRAATLTRQLLAFSRKQVMQPRVIDIDSAVSEMEDLLGRLIGEDVDLVMMPGIGTWNVRVDPGQLEQVIMNLVVNARDAMPGGGRITIRTENVILDEDHCRNHVSSHPGPYVALCVSDTGVGMNEETVGRIFEPFFTTKEQGKGTGLGLSTAYGIVQQSGGHIGVDSEPGRGATFRIYLPRAEKPPGTKDS